MSDCDHLKRQNVFCDKLKCLVEMSAFNDITFNCKDGGVNANRLVLSIYSNFLANIFSNNPLITSHPIHNLPDSGINLPELYVKDVQNLVNVINAVTAVDLKPDNLKGLQNAAKVLKVALIVSQYQSTVKVQAIPKNLEKDLEVGCTSRKILTGSQKDGSVKRNDLMNNVKAESTEYSGVNDESIEELGENDELESDNFLPDPNNKVVCPLCHITCKTPTGLRVHIGLSHRSNDEFTPQTDKGKRVCKCGKLFAVNSRKLFKEHKQRCTAYRKEAFICEICKSPFDEMPSLTIHLTSIHGINKQRNSCLCGQTFKTKHRVRKHSITCKKYRDAAVFCDVCKLPFLTNNHLQQHYRTSAHKVLVSRQKKRSVNVKK